MDLSSYYEISNFGKLRNTRTKRQLKVHANSKGYLYTVVSLGSRNKKKTIFLHRAVAERYIDNPKSMPQVNHKDGNKLNNNYYNLEWCSSQYNIKHAIDSGLLVIDGCNNHLSKLSPSDIVKIVEYRKSGLSYRQIAKKFNVSHPTIMDIISGKRYINELREI